MVDGELDKSVKPAMDVGRPTMVGRAGDELPIYKIYSVVVSGVR